MINDTFKTVFDYYANLFTVNATATIRLLQQHHAYLSHLKEVNNRNTNTAKEHINKAKETQNAHFEAFHEEQKEINKLLEVTKDVGMDNFWAFMGMTREDEKNVKNQQRRN